jgi:Uma2 family endonuclease
MTITESARAALEFRYFKAAQEYLESLPLEHFMESTPHATQRKITVESLDLLAARRADVHVFNELLVQYPVPRRRKLGQVVPDNMVVIHPHPIDADLSYNLPLVKVRPFWVLEYVSKESTRKDYVDNMRHYERHLKVPYYLLFNPRTLKVTLFHHHQKQYIPVKPNPAGRLELPDLNLEMAILGGWVRFWYKGKLLPLPAEMQNQLNAKDSEIAELRRENERLKSKKNGKH